jgi:hypothetical protein
MDRYVDGQTENGQKYRWAKRQWTYRQMDKLKDGQAYKCKTREMYRHTDGKKEKWTDKPMEKQRDGQTNQWTNREMDRH